MTTLYEDSVRLHLGTGDEVQAFVRRRGSGRAAKCLFLHGNPSTLLDWEQLVPFLDGLEVAAIDLPGFGRSLRSESNAEGVNLERLAAIAVAVADALSWREPFFIVGHSHGGGVAQAAAALHPTRVAGIVLLGTLGALRHEAYRMLALPGAKPAVRLASSAMRFKPLGPLSRRLLESVMKKIWWPEPVPPGRLKREFEFLLSNGQVFTTMVQVALGEPCRYLTHCAPRIRCRVLFLHGELDALVPVECARATHDLIVNAGGRSDFEVLLGSGHAIVDSRANEVARRILRFVLEVTQPTDPS